jgi:hypothetical protein
MEIITVVKIKQNNTALQPRYAYRSRETLESTIYKDGCLLGDRPDDGGSKVL